MRKTKQEIINGLMEHLILSSTFIPYRGKPGEVLESYKRRLSEEDIQTLSSCNGDDWTHRKDCLWRF